MESGASIRTPEEIFGKSGGVVALTNKAIRRMAEAATQSEILEAYLELARNWVSRAVLVPVQGRSACCLAYEWV